MECSNVETHKKIIQCQIITFQMMKNMFNMHKAIINNGHLICIHGKKMIQREK
jgi:hypothetical protein